MSFHVSVSPSNLLLNSVAKSIGTVAVRRLRLLYIYGFGFHRLSEGGCSDASNNCTHRSWTPRSVTRGVSRTNTSMCSTAGTVEIPTSHKNKVNKTQERCRWEQKPEQSTKGTHNKLIMITTKTKWVTLTSKSVPICKKRKRYGARKAETRFRASRMCA